MRQSDAASGHDRARVVERRHHDLETGFFATKPIFFGDIGIIEKESVGAHASCAHFVLFLSYHEAGRVFFDNEQVDLPAGLALAGFGRDKHEISVAGVCAPDLRTIDSVTLAVALRARFYSGDIGAALRFGEGQSGLQRPARKSWKIFGFLLFRAAGKNGSDRHPLKHQQVGRIVANPPKLLHGDTR